MRVHGVIVIIKTNGGETMFQIDFSSRSPIYEQLYYNVIKLASAGVIKPGDKLPPVRTVAAQLGINPNTAAKAYRELEQNGYIYSSVGRGSFLTDKLDESSAEKLMVMEEFTSAAKNAVKFGADKEQLIKIIEAVYPNEPKHP